MTGANTADETRESTAESIAAMLDDRDLVVVSNREPYSHEYADGEITVNRPAGGLTSALDPVMQAAEGTWVAWGSGEADAEASDEDDSVRMPPESPAYDLKRVWLTDGQVEGYYYGYSNQVLWPLCHIDTSKMTPSESYWNHYQDANGAFADAILDACDTADPVVWTQDYHLALAPALVREEKSKAFLAHFWHIPWPSWDVFQTCPQHDELLTGLLANDLLGFHTDKYCRNFLDCAAAFGAEVDRATRSVSFGRNRTFVRSFPLGVDAAEHERAAASADADEFWAGFSAGYGLDGTRVAVGVERLDYTKGIEPRLDALERLWETCPEWRGELTYVQKGTESRSEIPAYSDLQTRVAERIDDVNERFGTDDWQPVVYLTEFVPQEGLAALYREADLALVTPIRDGMNLVAKEYVAAQTDDPGVLVLSELAGAAEELGAESLVVHPYDTSGFAETIETALTLPDADRERRMDELGREVAANDVYAWMASQFRTVQAIQRGRELQSRLPAQ